MITGEIKVLEVTFESEYAWIFFLKNSILVFDKEMATYMLRI